MLALAAFNLGRYSEHFSGSGWGWGALVLNVLLLCWLLYSIISDCQREDTRLTKARHVFERSLCLGFGCLVGDRLDELGDRLVLPAGLRFRGRRCGSIFLDANDEGKKRINENVAPAWTGN
jgi:hypothetical protein